MTCTDTWVQKAERLVRTYTEHGRGLRKRVHLVVADTSILTALMISACDFLPGSAAASFMYMVTDAKMGPGAVASFFAHHSHVSLTTPYLYPRGPLQWDDSGWPAF